MSLKKVSFSTLCVILFASFIILMVSTAADLPLPTAVQSGITQLPNIVIDAGHGGEDGGAVSDSGVIEKDLNLSIALKTADYLRFLGFDVTMTRTTDTDLSSGEETVHARKAADLKKRLETFNSSENNVVISIHQNKFEQEKYSGTQIFYSTNREGSSVLAECIKNAVTGLLQPDNTRECKPSDDGIYILKNAEVTAVLVECGFISNPEECKNLTDENYQKKLSFAIANGLLEYTESGTI